MRCTRHTINILIYINLNYINEYKSKTNFCFKMYTSKPLYVNYINHTNLVFYMLTCIVHTHIN